MFFARIRYNVRFACMLLGPINSWQSRREKVLKVVVLICNYWNWTMTIRNAITRKFDQSRLSYTLACVHMSSIRMFKGGLRTNTAQTCEKCRLYIFLKLTVAVIIILYIIEDETTTKISKIWFLCVPTSSKFCWNTARRLTINVLILCV